MLQRLLVNIDVDDLERGIRFYTEGLGLTLTRRFADGWAELAGEGLHVYLLPKPDGSQTGAAAGTRSYRRHWTPVHLDFVVSALEPAIERAVEAGAVREGAIVAQPYGRLALMADPFGHGFCFLEFSELGYDALVSTRPLR